MSAIRALTCDNETDRRGAGNAPTVLTHLSDHSGRGLGVSLPSSEEWRPVVGYEGRYEVSNLGRLRSLKKQPPRVLSPTPNRFGYRFIGLRRGGVVQERTSVHRLVATAFRPRLDGQNIVRHLDGNALNNAAANLAWGTQSENNYDAFRHGTRVLATHCVNGHEYTAENTYYVNYRSRKARGCRICLAATRARQRRGPRVITHCKRGHEFTLENTYQNRGRRICRLCRQLHQATYRQCKRATAPTTGGNE